MIWKIGGARLGHVANSLFSATLQNSSAALRVTRFIWLQSLPLTHSFLAPPAKSKAVAQDPLALCNSRKRAADVTGSHGCYYSEWEFVMLKYLSIAHWCRNPLTLRYRQVTLKEVWLSLRKSTLLLVNEVWDSPILSHTIECWWEQA